MVQWLRKFVSIPLGYEYERFELDCLGAWTYHPTIDDLKLSTKPDALWVVTHITTGRALVRTRNAQDARQVVEFVAAVWPRPRRLNENAQTRNLIWDALLRGRETGELAFFFPREDPVLIENRRLERELIAAFA